MSMSFYALASGEASGLIGDGEEVELAFRLIVDHSLNDHVVVKRTDDQRMIALRQFDGSLCLGLTTQHVIVPFWAMIFHTE